MNSYVAWTAEDDRRPYSATTLAEDGPWARWIPDAWRAVADPSGRHAVPPVPKSLRSGRPWQYDDSHAEVIAWWTPLDHLLEFGLGWTRSSLGLVRWLALGRPTGDPTLKVIDDWWGTYVLDYAAWHGDGLESDLTSPAEFFWLEKIHQRRADEDWTKAWGGGGSDPFHLSGHRTPEQPDSASETMFFVPTSNSTASMLAASADRVSLVAGSYAGWYRKLMGYSGESPTGRSHRVDVTCRGLGWIGEYRKSRRSGRWFQGRHRSHELGI
jgi:hypothetical protein